ncbi:MAG: BrnT family toxin [Chloroflexi bacterium]|nr:BrnT family toxin [Chloroflexota bacterium]
MPFEYDPDKSLLNREKHGIDFDEAQFLWDDENRLEIPAKTVDEPRYLVIGQINSRFWSAVITYRGGNVRIISVRRSRDEEMELYENR